MPVQFMHDATEAIVTVDGTKHRFDVGGDVGELENHSYEGPAEEAPDAVLKELQDHIDEHIDPEWACDDCGDTFDSQQEYAAHHPCEEAE